jgi:hypothetical protein
MSTPYSAELRQDQEPYLDSGNILDDVTLDATIVDSGEYRRRETSAWRAKLNADQTTTEIILHGVINEWLTGCYDEEVAVGWLYALRLLPDAVDADFYELMSRLAFSELGPVALPERLTAPIPSVSSSKPFQPVGERA